MTQLIVTQQADGTFRVQTPAGTSHEVSVPTGFAASLGCGQVAPEELVRASFEFLLEREAATSILREFSLDVQVPRLSACAPLSMGQKAGGSSRSERAQVNGPLLAVGMLGRAAAGLSEQLACV